MRKLKIENLAPGMVLSKPLLDPNGKTLLGAGATLTDKIVARVASMNVAMVFVEGDPQSEEEIHRPAVGYLSQNKTRQELLDQVDRKFRNALSDPLMVELKHCITARITANTPEHP